MKDVLFSYMFSETQTKNSDLPWVYSNTSFFFRVFNLTQRLVLLTRSYCTVESLEFVVAQFSWYSWVALKHKFTASMKTYCKIYSFPTEFKNRRTQDITSQQISKTPKVNEIWPP